MHYGRSCFTLLSYLCIFSKYIDPRKNEKISSPEDNYEKSRNIEVAIFNIGLDLHRLLYDPVFFDLFYDF